MRLKKELDRFAQNYPSEPSTVKDLRKKLFSLDSDFGGTANPNSPRKPIGFGTPNPSPISDDGDDFFGTPPKTKQPRKVATKKESQNNQTKKMIFLTVQRQILMIAVSQNKNIQITTSIFNK